MIDYFVCFLDLGINSGLGWLIIGLINILLGFLSMTFNSFSVLIVAIAIRCLSRLFPPSLFIYNGHNFSYRLRLRFTLSLVSPILRDCLYFVNSISSPDGLIYAYLRLLWILFLELFMLVNKFLFLVDFLIVFNIGFASVQGLNSVAGLLARLFWA